MSRSRRRKDPEPPSDPEEEDEPGALIAFVRLLQGLKQYELADAAAMDPSRISRYEAGKEIPEPATLVRITGAGGLRPSLEAPVRSFLRLIRRALRGAGPSEPVLPGPGRPAEAAQRAVWGIVERSLSLARLELSVLRSIEEDSRPARPTAADQSRVEDLLARLRRFKPGQRRFLVQESKAFQDWLLCVRLCEESVQAAAHSAQEALEWALLACEVAGRVPGPEAWRSFLRGFAEATLANAFRVGNRYQEAQEAFARGRRLREKGRDDDGLLDPGRPVDLEASLCRDQRRFDDAIKLHDEALAVARPDQIAVILLNKAYTLEEKGDHEASIEVLEEAAGRLDGQNQPRLLFGVLFNVAGNLLRLGKAKKAEPIIVEVRALAERLRNDLDLIRTRWLEANASAGLGQRAEALEGLEEVRRAFVKRELPFDFALASLDLALLHLKDGRLAEVKELAVEMVEIFRQMGVLREAIAAVLVFQDAARREAVTTDLVERLQEFFKRAPGNPKVRFEG